MKHIFDLKNEPITPDKILEIHRLITNGTLEKPEYEGNFRENNETAVSILTTAHYFHKPVEYSEVPELVGKLCDFVNNKDNDFIHPRYKGNNRPNTLSDTSTPSTTAMAGAARALFSLDLSF